MQTECRKQVFLLRCSLFSRLQMSFCGRKVTHYNINKRRKTDYFSFFLVFCALICTFAATKRINTIIKYETD